MIVLLPPSEGKTRPASGAPVSLGELSFPDLELHRIEVLDALAAVSSRDDACAALGVGASLAEEVEANTSLREAPAAPAHEVYTGVLYEALDAASLPRTARQRLSEVCVVSALFGCVRLTDRIPAYRLSMGAALPDFGRMKSWWKPRLSPVLDEAFAGELILDCRSSDYRAAWPGDPSRTVTVAVSVENDGKRKVVSHSAKHTRGELVGHLLRRRGGLPDSVDALVRAAGKHYRVEFTEHTKSKPAVLTVVLDG